MAQKKTQKELAYDVYLKQLRKEQEMDLDFDPVEKIVAIEEYREECAKELKESGVRW